MASSDSSAQISANGTSDKQATLSAAQRLMQKHHDEVHKATIEEVPDEEDLRHTPEPVSASVLESTEEAALPSQWGSTMSAKAAGKQKEASAPKEKIPLLDTESTELFPGLGGVPKSVQPAPSKPSWVAKPSPGASKATNGGANGISTNGSSTPNSGMNTPPSAPIYSAPKGASMSLAGNQGPPILVLQKHEVLPRNQLKKPLAEIVKDVNKKHRTNMTVSAGEGGILEFRETMPPKDSVRNQALRDLGVQIGAKVRTSNRSIAPFTNRFIDIKPSPDPPFCPSPYHRQTGCDH
jgi:hypothetical protein